MGDSDPAGPPAPNRPPDAPGPPEAVTLAQAARFWFRIGCISFGGPAGQIALMHEELVTRRRWISERRFLHALNYCMLLPGPEAQQLATYIGWLMHRTAGGVAAGALFVLPSLALLIGLSWAYVAWGDVAWVAWAFYGIKPAVMAIVVHAAWRIGGRALRSGPLWGLAGASFVAIFAFDVPFPAIVAAAAALGLAGGRIWPEAFRAGGGHRGGDGPHGPALIDDATPVPEHARFRPARLARQVAAGGALWAAPMGLLTALGGWHGMGAQMGWFFTKAALVTFGGAYAVLPYVVQGAVGHYGWLTGPQMIDGLALGETTPGPLIIIVAFVGFVGGWSADLAGLDPPWAAAVTGAVLVTWFTFLPSFLFILAGGPLVEGTRHEPRVTAPLTAITAAVVGVVGNLAVFFAGHVLWPGGVAGGFDGPAAAIAAGAAALLFGARLGVVPVIALGAAAGLAGKALGL